MTQMIISEGKLLWRKAVMVMTAAMTACILLFGCATPAFAKVDPGWNGSTNVNQQTDGQDSAYGKEPDQIPEPDEGKEGSEQGSDGQGTSGQEGDGQEGGTQEDRQGGDGATAEQGFTTPGNASLGDQIRSSNGKDFFTIKTKNNNTFYLVIDHANSTDNVYMLSLIDEDDLAEFMKKEPEKATQTASLPSILPETHKEKETEAPAGKQEEVPARENPIKQNLGLIVIAAAGFAGVLYYFKVYKPRREEEEEDYSEGLETEGDGLPTEREE